MTHDILVTYEWPEAGLKELRKRYNVDYNTEDRFLSKEELTQRLDGKSAVLSILRDQIDDDVLAANPQLSIVANGAVGFDNIDVEAATERDIVVTNAPGVSEESVADHAIGLMLAAARRTVEADSFVRSGKFHGWKPMQLLGTDVYNKTIGIVGLGRVGKGIARRARGFGMTAFYHDVQRYKEFEKEHTIRYRKKDTILDAADILILAMPLNDATHHWLGVKELNALNDDAIVVNVGRGALIDEEALVHALRHGVIRAAGIDVFEGEPHVSDGLLELDNTVLTPHIASSTYAVREDMAALAAKNITRVLEGKQPKTPVNDLNVGNGFVHPFYFKNGVVVKSLDALTDALDDATEADFQHHVDDDRNDFATWINDVIGDSELARDVKQATTLEELKTTLNTGD
jgi:lactate dehydrogenase-like 2-hydroxyacid dehydrogenase